LPKITEEQKEAAKFAAREAEALKNDEKNPRLKLKATTLMRVPYYKQKFQLSCLEYKQ
jgi:hypothetical protein